MVHNESNPESQLQWYAECSSNHPFDKLHSQKVLPRYWPVPDCSSRQFEHPFWQKHCSKVHSLPVGSDLQCRLSWTCWMVGQMCFAGFYLPIVRKGLIILSGREKLKLEDLSFTEQVIWNSLKIWIKANSHSGEVQILCKALRNMVWGCLTYPPQLLGHFNRDTVGEDMGLSQTGGPNSTGLYSFLITSPKKQAIFWGLLAILRYIQILWSKLYAKAPTVELRKGACDYLCEMLQKGTQLAAPELPQRTKHGTVNPQTEGDNRRFRVSDASDYE